MAGSPLFGLNITFESLTDNWYTWLVALAVGLLMGAIVGGLQGYIIAYVGVPAFIVTLGGFLAWRGMIFRTGDKQGQTLSPLDDTFSYLGGAPEQSLGAGKSWVIVVLACVGHRVQHRHGAPAPQSSRSRRALDGDRRRVRRRRVWCGDLRGVADRHQVRLADQRQSGRHRLPGADPDRDHAADDLSRQTTAIRSLRVRLRRQPRGCRAGRHQHPSHDHLYVRRDGHVVRGQRSHPDRCDSTRPPPTSVSRTSSM